jgi:hypothetical protein
VFESLAPDAFDDTVAPAPAGSRGIVAVTRAPALSLADLDVGSSGLGFPGPEWFVSVVNEGPSTFVPATVESSNPEFGVSGGTCALGTPVPPGGSCTVNVVLTPSALGPVTGTLRVAEAGFGAQAVEATLTGAGGGAQLAASPAGLDLPPVLVGTPTEPGSVQVFNVGYGPLTIAWLELTGTDAADVVIDTTTCRGATLAIGASCTIDLVVTPSAAGRRTATLRVGTSTGEYTTVMLSTAGTLSPELVVPSTEVVTGSRLSVAGTGFAPATPLTVQWADGSGRRTSTVTDGDGGFWITMLVGVGERTGDRTIVAQAADGTTATIGVTVHPAPARPGATSPAHRGG